MDLKKDIEDASRELVAARDREGRAARRVSIARIKAIVCTVLVLALYALTRLNAEFRTAWWAAAVLAITAGWAWSVCAHRRTLRVRATRVREEAEAKQLAAINRQLRVEAAMRDLPPRASDVTVTDYDEPPTPSMYAAGLRHAPPTRDSGVMAAARYPDFTQEALSGGQATTKADPNRPLMGNPGSATLPPGAPLRATNPDLVFGSRAKIASPPAEVVRVIRDHLRPGEHVDEVDDRPLTAADYGMDSKSPHQQEFEAQNRRVSELVDSLTTAEPRDRFPTLASIAPRTTALLAEARAWSPEDQRQRNRANYWADRRYDFEQRYAGREEFKAILASQRVPTMTGAEARRIADGVRELGKQRTQLLMPAPGMAEGAEKSTQLVAAAAVQDLSDHAHHGAAMMARSIEILTSQRDELLGDQLGKAMQAIAVQQAAHQLETLGDHIRDLMELGDKLRDPAERVKVLAALEGLMADVEGLRIVEGAVDGAEDA